MFLTASEPQISILISSNICVQIIKNLILTPYKFALLWGEAHLCLPYVCL